MNANTVPSDSNIARLVDEQLELAAAKLPALNPAIVHPTLEDVLLGKAEPTPEMLETLAALNAAPELSEEELARQALADGGADADPATPE